MIKDVIQKILLLPKVNLNHLLQVDEDDDSAISFREFLMIFRKARMGELDMESGLGKLASLSEVDVDAVGVGGAKTFFEAKVLCSWSSCWGDAIPWQLFSYRERLWEDINRKKNIFFRALPESPKPPPWPQFGQLGPLFWTSKTTLYTYDWNLFDDDNDGFNDNYDDNFGNFDDNYDKSD